MLISALNRRIYHQPSGIVTRGLVSRWAHTEGTGTSLGDSVGGRNGTLTNGPPWAAGPNGLGAIDYAGTNKYTSVPHATAFNALPLTFTFWINGPPTGQATYAAPFGKWASNNGFSAYLYGPSVYFNYYASSSNKVAGTVATSRFMTSTWQVVAVTVHSGGMDVYAGGTKTSLSWIGTPGAVSNTNALLFASANTCVPVIAKMSDIRFYNVQLTDAEIVLIASGAG